MIECPACAGPAEVRQGCATCDGIMEVTQEVFDAFMLQKAELDKVIDFWNKVQEFMYQDGEFTFEANGEVFQIGKEISETILDTE
jgi:hypothetical protein